MTYTAHFRVWRGDDEGGQLHDYDVEVNEGEVVLDIIHRLQATKAPDLAVRWNCKAGKCGSCSAEVNGHPRLMCMARMALFDPAETITVTVIDEGPGIRGDISRIFQRFYTDRPDAERFGDHSGLGLAISKQIIEAHKGTIRAANRTDRSGAMFTVVLNRAPSEQRPRK